MSDLQTEHAVVYYDKYLSFKKKHRDFLNIGGFNTGSSRSRCKLNKPLIAVRGLFTYF